MDSPSRTDTSSVGSPSRPQDLEQGYTCDICGATLSRSAHLQRHRARHSTAAAKSFLCRVCGKSFSRKDVYQRHKRSVHGNEASRRNRRKKSCQRCIRYKLRCSRESPCLSCRDRAAQCVYDTGGVGQEDKDEQDGPSTSLDALVDAANFIHGSTSSTTTVEITNSLEGQTGDSTLEITASTLPDCEAESNSFLFTRPNDLTEDLNLDHTYNQDDGLNHPNRNLDSLDGLLQEQHEHLVHSGAEQSNMGISVSDFNMELPQFDLHGWDILLGCDTEPSEGVSPGISLGRSSHKAADQPRLDELTAYSEEMTSPITHLEGEELDQRAERQHQKRRYADSEESWPAVLDRGGNETWPFDYTSNKGFRRITLPPLKEVLEQTVASRPHIQKNILGDLIKVLSAPQIPSFNDTPALEAMPAVAFLGEFTRVYFAEFHNFLPVIHVPTWRIERCPTALLAAIACIGATYSTAEGSGEVSALLAEITQRALFWMGQQDSSAFRNKEYITASCFHQIYALGSGNRRLYEIADASRGLLVTSLRGLGVLSSESTSSTVDSIRLDPKHLKTMSPADLETAWLAWRDKEMEKRMAWAVFEFDCTLSTMTSKRAAFRIAELPARLPCSESMWEAHSARAWAALVPFAVSPPTGLLFYPVLRQIIAHRTVPMNAPAWAKRLCAHAIGRILHDMKEVQDASAPNILGLPSMTETHEETKRSLLGSLESLEESLAKPTCTADVVNINVLSLASHRSHLNSAGHEIMDLVINIFRSSGQRSGEVAEERLRYIFRDQPVRTRRLVFHSGAIIAIARDCTINTPCETLSVFMGYAFVLAYVKLFPFRDFDVGDANEVAKLDEIPWTSGPDAAARIEKWIQNGGPASLGCIKNICDRESFQAAKQVALDALTKLSVWGLAGKFRQTVNRFV